MPTAPLRPCAADAYCPERVTHGYCPAHRKAAGEHRRAKERTAIGHKGGLVNYYQTREWKRLRDTVRLEEPFCRRCPRVTEHVDHIVPREQGGPDTRDNLQGLCSSCHSAKTLSEQRSVARVDRGGQP